MLNKPTKNWVVALLLSIFLGMFGLDRLYLGHIELGLAKLFLHWGTFGIWWLVDVFLVATRRVNDEDFYWDDSAQARRQAAGVVHSY